MLPVVKELIQPIGEHNPPQECVKTESVAHLIKYPFSHFNPMQSLFIPWVDEEQHNVVVTSPTCSGKTVIAELSVAQCVFGSNGAKKAVYLAPMKSLAEEKLADWSEEGHAFSHLKITALTSDYVLNPAKRNALDTANIVLCTSEMLDSKTRTYDRNTWLHNVGCIVVDESHLLGQKERGPRLETALMRFTRYNPNCRLILMSATCPNYKDYCKWMNKLTGKQTVMVNSEYRPCILNIHYVPVDDVPGRKNTAYADMENARMDAALSLVRRFPQDQFMIFTGNKTWGRNFLPLLRGQGFNADFHNADQSMTARRSMEKDFNSERIGKLIASSTLAWGVNVNARRVILAHTTYGLQPMGVEDILQVCGRAGRVRYHKEGDAYVLIPASKIEAERRRIEGGFEVKSKLNEVKPLIFHIVNEIDQGKIKSAEDLYAWYDRSLAAVQHNPLKKETCEMVLQKLVNMKMIQQVQGGTDFEATPLGTVASLMYQDPFNCYDWFRNFLDIPSIDHEHHPNDPVAQKEAKVIDANVCYALANIDEYKGGNVFMSKADQQSPMVQEFCNFTGKEADSAVIKVAAIYWNMIQGKDIDDQMRSMSMQLSNDLQRMISTIALIHDKFGQRFTKNSQVLRGYKFPVKAWNTLFYRMKHGVPRHLVDLVHLPEVGKVTAEKLYSRGIQNAQEVISNPGLVKEVMGKKAEKLYTKLREQAEAAAKK
jgi:replicative superfamily II helicase